jgi:crotonobetainyl-CoA:carnitine CoA-transferase CaiB-like acyl-CoA transferase
MSASHLPDRSEGQLQSPPDDAPVLRGIRVVDWTRGPAGFRATSLLADYGADVVWIESPVDDSSPFVDPVTRAVFCRNKRSVVLDLTTSQGKGQMRTLLGGADVVVVGQDPGIAEQLGFGYRALHADLPSLVYCSLSAFGPGVSSGEQELPAYEALVHAQVGTMGEQVGYREPPIYEGVPFAGLGMAYLAQIGILAALYRRKFDGVGRCVETSMLDGALSFLSMMWGHADSDDVAAPIEPGGQRLVVRTFLCADDEYLGVHTGASGAFGRLMTELGLSDRIPPATRGVDIGVALTVEHQRIIETEIPEIFLRRPRAVWLRKLLAADICAMPAFRPTEVFDEAQVRHNGMVTKLDDPLLGLIEQVAAPLRFGNADAVPPPPVPAPLPGSTTIAEAIATRPTRPVTSSTTSVATSRSAEETRPPLLRGLKVLDFGVWYAPSYSSRMLADLGADVVKVEPLAGDQMRGIRRPFQSAHSRKRSFAADLKHPDMAAVIPRLLAWADVVHHNMRPGAAERLGIGYEQAKLVNSDVIYLHAPGWGTSGPEMARQSFAPLVSGYVGASYEVAGQFNPPTYPVGNEDPGAGMLGAIGVLMALVRGGGTYIELPQVNAAMNQVAHVVRGSDGEPLNAIRLDPLQRRVGPVDGLYQTSDSWICIVAGTPQQLHALGAEVGIDLEFDPYVPNTEQGHPSFEALTSRLEEAFARRTAAHWLERFKRVGVPAVRPETTNNNRAFHFDPDNRRTRRVSEAEYIDGGNGRQIDTLIRIADVEIPPYRPAPGLGQHTVELLTEIGYQTADLDALLRAKAIRVGGANRVPSSPSGQPGVTEGHHPNGRSHR